MSTTRKPTKRQTEKQVAREHKVLLDLVSEYVFANGGSVEAPAGSVEWPLDLVSWRMQLPTILGKLSISVYDDWLACRFEDIDRAVRHFGEGGRGLLNPNSGKWNWGCGERALAVDLFERWAQAVTVLLPLHPDDKCSECSKHVDRCECPRSNYAAGEPRHRRQFSFRVFSVPGRREDGRDTCWYIERRVGEGRHVEIGTGPKCPEITLPAACALLGIES